MGTDPGSAVRHPYITKLQKLADLNDTLEMVESTIDESGKEIAKLHRMLRFEQGRNQQARELATTLRGKIEALTGRPIFDPNPFEPT